MKFPGIGVPTTRRARREITPLHQQQPHFIFRSPETALYTGEPAATPSAEDIAHAVVEQSVELQQIPLTEESAG